MALLLTKQLGYHYHNLTPLIRSNNNALVGFNIMIWFIYNAALAVSARCGCGSVGRKVNQSVGRSVSEQLSAAKHNK